MSALLWATLPRTLLKLLPSLAAALLRESTIPALLAAGALLKIPLAGTLLETALLAALREIPLAGTLPALLWAALPWTLLLLRRLAGTSRLLRWLPSGTLARLGWQLNKSNLIAKLRRRRNGRRRRRGRWRRRVWSRFWRFGNGRRRRHGSGRRRMGWRRRRFSGRWSNGMFDSGDDGFGRNGFGL